MKHFKVALLAVLLSLACTFQVSAQCRAEQWELRASENIYHSSPCGSGEREFKLTLQPDADNTAKTSELKALVYTLSGTSYNGLRLERRGQETGRRSISKVVFYDVPPGEYQISLTAKCPDGQTMQISSKNIQVKETDDERTYEAYISSTTASPACEASPMGRIAVSAEEGVINVKVKGASLPSPQVFHALTPTEGRKYLLPSVYPAGTYEIEVSPTHNPCGRAPVVLQAVVADKLNVTTEVGSYRDDQYDDNREVIGSKIIYYANLSSDNYPYESLSNLSIRLVSGPGITTPIPIEISNEHADGSEGRFRVNLIPAFDNWQPGDYVAEISVGCLTQRVPFSLPSNTFSIRVTDTTMTVQEGVCASGMSLQVYPRSNATFPIAATSDFAFRILKSPSSNTPQEFTPLRVNTEGGQNNPRYEYLTPTDEWEEGEYVIEVRDVRNQWTSTDTYRITRPRFELDMSRSVLSRVNQATGALSLEIAPYTEPIIYSATKLVIEKAPPHFENYGRQIEASPDRYGEYLSGKILFPTRDYRSSPYRPIYYPAGEYEIGFYEGGCRRSKQIIYFPPQEATLSEAYSRPSSSCAPTGIIALQIQNRRSEMGEDDQFTFTLISGPGVTAPTPIATRYRRKGIFQFVGENWAAGDYVVEITDHEVNRSTRQSFTLPVEEPKAKFNPHRSYGKDACQSTGVIALDVPGASAPLTFRVKQAPGQVGERLVQATRTDSVYLLEGTDWRAGDYRLELASATTNCPDAFKIAFTLPSKPWEAYLDHKSTTPAKGCQGGRFVIGVRTNEEIPTLTFTLLEATGVNTPQPITPRQENGLYIFEGEQWKAGRYLLRVSIPGCDTEQEIPVLLGSEPDFMLMDGKSQKKCYDCLGGKPIEVRSKSVEKQNYSFSFIEGPSITEPRPAVTIDEGKGDYYVLTRDLTPGQYTLQVTNTQCGTSQTMHVDVSTPRDEINPYCIAVHPLNHRKVKSYPCGTATIALRIPRGTCSGYRFKLTKAPDGITVPQEVEASTTDNLTYRLNGNNWPPGDYAITVEDRSCETCQGSLSFSIGSLNPPQVVFLDGYAQECTPGSIRLRVVNGSGNFRFIVVRGPGFTEETPVTAEVRDGAYHLKGYDWKAGEYRIAVEEDGNCKSYRTVTNFTIRERPKMKITSYDGAPMLRVKDKITLSYKRAINHQGLQMGIALPGQTPDHWEDLMLSKKDYDFPVPIGRSVSDLYDRPFFVHFRFKDCPDSETSFEKRLLRGKIQYSRLRLGLTHWASTFQIQDGSHLFPGTLEITEKGLSTPIYTAPWNKDTVNTTPIFEYNKTYVVKFTDANGVSITTEIRQDWDLRADRDASLEEEDTDCGRIALGYRNNIYLTRLFVNGKEEKYVSKQELLEELLPITTTWTPDDGSPILTKKIWYVEDLRSPLFKFGVIYRGDIVLKNGLSHSSNTYTEPPTRTFHTVSLERRGCDRIGVIGRGGERLAPGTYTLTDPTGQKQTHKQNWTNDRNDRNEFFFYPQNFPPGEYTLTYDGKCAAPYSIKKHFTQGGANLRNIQIVKDLFCEGLKFRVTADYYCGEKFQSKVFLEPKWGDVEDRGNGEYMLRRPGSSTRMSYGSLDGPTIKFELPPMDLDQLYTVGYKCPDSPTGSILIKAKNGVKPYTYSLVTAKGSSTLLPNTESQTSSDVVEYEYGEVGNTYAVLIEDACGNRAWDEITIRPLDQIGTVVGTKTPEICIGGDIQLFSRAFGAAATYAWSGPDGFTSTEANPTITGATPAKSGTYTLTLQPRGCNLSITQSVEVLVKEPLALVPSEEASRQITYCVGSAVPVLDGGASVTGGVAPIRYQWQESYDRGLNWYKIYGAIQETYEPSGLRSGVIYYYRRVVSDPCTSVEGPTIQVKAKSCWVPVNPHLMHRVGKAPR